jgi:hypothetical protein
MINIAKIFMKCLTDRYRVRTNLKTKHKQTVDYLEPEVGTASDATEESITEGAGPDKYRHALGAFEHQAGEPVWSPSLFQRCFAQIKRLDPIREAQLLGRNDEKSVP